MSAVAEYGPFVEWDERNWSVAPAFWEERTRLDLRTCAALELGGRHGGLSHWLALRGAEVTCSDLDGPSPRARERHHTAGVADRVTYAALDATQLEFDGEFDIVVFKSLLGALDGPDRVATQRAAIAGMHRALRPGGELFFAENLLASPAHRFLRQRYVAWGRRWRYVAIKEMLDFLSPFSHVEYRTIGFSGAFGRSRRQRSILGAMDRAGLDRLVPPRWRYIILGVARR
jgi:SAM-dependent methyltransferase